jgi:hypothetical protein
MTPKAEIANSLSLKFSKGEDKSIELILVPMLLIVLYL